MNSLRCVLALAVLISAPAVADSASDSLLLALEQEKALAEARPDDADVQNDLGNLLLLTGDEAGAEAAYRTALRIAPEKTTALFNLAILEQRRGDTAAAREGFEQILALDPRHAWAHYELGFLDEQRGEKNKAMRHYAEAFTWDPYLLFPEVNPQIIESRLVTKSLLLARRSERLGTQTVRPLYEDPGLIVRLLTLPSPGEGDSPEGAPAPDAPEAAAPDAAP